MRLLILGAIAGALIACPIANAQTPKAEAPTLKVGDKAPAFKPDKWLQGKGVAFETGKIYVVEFWATWCGPCIAMMPHLADMAEEYKEKGVTVIGFSSSAQDQLAKAEKFLEKRGPKLGYTFAWGDNDAVHRAWMNASGQQGIPCSFVVDKEGKLAYIGHPLFLDMVLPKILDDKWDNEKGKAELEAADKDFDKAYEASRNPDPAAGLKVLEDVLAARPTFADVPYLLGPKLELLVKNKKFADAQKAAEKVLAKAAKRSDTNSLRTVRGALLNDLAKGEKGLVSIALKAAEMDREITGTDDAGATIRLVEAYTAAGETDKAKKLAADAVTLAQKAIKDDKDWQGNLLLASAHKAAGDEAAAKTAAEKAVELAGSQPGLKEYVAEQAKKYGVGVTPATGEKPGK